MERGSKRKRLRAPSPAMVVACIALTVTLSGVSYAAALAKNSVGSAQLKDNAVGTKKVANNALTGSDINESTLAGGSITGVNAALLGGHPASDFELASAGGGSDSYVVSGGAWNDRDGLMPERRRRPRTAGARLEDPVVHHPRLRHSGRLRGDPSSAGRPGDEDDGRLQGRRRHDRLERHRRPVPDAALHERRLGHRGAISPTRTLGNIGLGDAAVALDNTIGDAQPEPRHDRQLEVLVHADRQPRSQHGRRVLLGRDRRTTCRKADRIHESSEGRRKAPLVVSGATMRQ